MPPRFKRKTMMLFIIFFSTAISGIILTPALASTYFNTPAVTTTLTGIGAWFNPLFSDFWDWGLIAIGVSLVFLIIGWLIHQFQKGLHH